MPSYPHSPKSKPAKLSRTTLKKMAWRAKQAEKLRKHNVLKESRRIDAEFRRITDG